MRKLFLALEKYNINESNFEPHKTYKVVGDVLEDFYNVLDN